MLIITKKICAKFSNEIHNYYARLWYNKEIKRSLFIFLIKFTLFTRNLKSMQKKLEYGLTRRDSNDQKRNDRDASCRRTGK